MEWLTFTTQLPLPDRAAGNNYRVGGMRTDIRGLVLHITDGHSTLQSEVGHFSHPARNHRTWGVSAHFAISRAGEIAQYLPLSARANTIDSYDHDAHWYSVENVAVIGESLTDPQLEGVAKLFAWLVNYRNIPVRLANSPNDTGLGYHAMFHIGDHSCPGRHVIEQRNEILRRTHIELARDAAQLRRDLSGL